MNEKIHELAVAAGWNSNQYMPPGEAFEYFDLNQFAEKIIRECSNVINDDCKFQYDSGVISNLGGLNQARELIKRHFGVE